MTAEQPRADHTAAWAVCVPVTTLWNDPADVREVDAPMLSDPPDPSAWAQRLTTADKHDLGRCLTQLLYGEPVQVLQRDGEFTYVVAPWQPSSLDTRGYPGWVPTAHLAERPPDTAGQAMVTASTAPLRPDDGGDDDTLSYATVLPVQETSATEVRVALPGGAFGSVPAEAVALHSRLRPDRVMDPVEALAQARRFVGLEYLWGGMSTYGLDCSGLVHITFRRLGGIVPRDAHDQAETLPDVELASVTAGDLLFFARPERRIHHVGFATNAGYDMVHAPGTGNAVEDTTMNDERRATLVGAARAGVPR